tara:strand:- start:5267 stop:5515 length:249 start_codon:yes stop_codon:yes gene_type:complete
VGGSTIAEAQQRLGYQEALQWMRYRKLRGSFNLGIRVERGAAQLSMLYVNAHSKNGSYKIYDFMPHMEEPPMTLEQAMKVWE